MVYRHDNETQVIADPTSPPDSPPTGGPPAGPSQHTTPGWRRRRWKLAAATGAIVLTGAGALVAYLVRAGGSPSDSPTVPSLSQALDQVTATPSLTISDSGSLAVERHTFRVVSAPTDLTGLNELAWVADSGHSVGDAQCTKNFRIGQGASAYIRPTMLICWRTSITKSVYTVAVDLDDPPSESESVAAIERVWATMD